MTMIAYAFLQHRHLTQVGRKKESTDRRLSLACRPYATPSSISFFDHYLSNAHTAEDEAVKNSGVGKSAKVVLVVRFIQIEGYKCLSLTRALDVVKCQLALV